MTGILLPNAKGYAFPGHEKVGHLNKKGKPCLKRDLWASQG